MGESSLERRPVFSDESQSFYVPEDHVQLHPVFEGLCTGWSWALFLANGAVAFPVSGELRNPLVRFGIGCPPDMGHQHGITGAYADNISIVGSSSLAVQRARDSISTRFEKDDSQTSEWRPVCGEISL